MWARVAVAVASVTGLLAAARLATEADRGRSEAGAAGPAPRRVRIKDQAFVLAATGEPIVLAGPNVVVKGPPYLPEVAGTTHCDDSRTQNATCAATGTCETCTTFNEADVRLIQAQGRNFIRLGVVWAGAQPRDADELDPDFLRRLHAILDLTDRTGIHVMLDNHGDMTSSAACGNGVPMWFSQKAAPELIGKPLVTGYPFHLIHDLRIDKVGGFDTCLTDPEKWAKFAGDPNYNLLNECCLAMNGPNPAGLGWTTLNQKTMEYMLEGEGRADFVRYWTLLAEAVAQHPSAFALELANEPMSINRRHMYDTWRAVTESAMQIVPDISVSVADTGEGAVFPGWLYELLDHVPLPYLAPSHDTVEWMQKSQNVFFAWHWYGSPSVSEAVKNVKGVMKAWNVPSFATEFISCDVWSATEAAGISHSYWHYSAYCNTPGPGRGEFGNRSVPSETFGGCVLGWGGGSYDRCVPGAHEAWVWV